MNLNEKIELIKSSSSKEILNGGSHNGVPLLKYVFQVHEEVFGIPCKSCSSLLPTYINKIQFLNLNEEIMSTKNREYRMKAGSVIRLSGTNKYYSDLNITDDIAKQLLKVNPNRAALFAKIPEGALEQLAKEVEAEKEEAKRIENEKIEAAKAADLAQKHAEEEEAQRLADEATETEAKKLEVVTDGNDQDTNTEAETTKTESDTTNTEVAEEVKAQDSKPVEKSDLELNMIELRAKYPHVKARSKEEFLRELNA